MKKLFYASLYPFFVSIFIYFSFIPVMVHLYSLKENKPYSIENQEKALNFFGFTSDSILYISILFFGVGYLLILSFLFDFKMLKNKFK